MRATLSELADLDIESPATIVIGAVAAFDFTQPTTAISTDLVI